MATDVLTKFNGKPINLQVATKLVAGENIKIEGDVISALVRAEYTGAISWGVGGLGSSGEYYQSRTTDIAMLNFLDFDDIVEVEVDDSLIFDLCLYNSSGSKVVRLRPYSGHSFKTKDMQEAYPSATKFKVALYENPAVEQTDTSYSKRIKFIANLKQGGGITITDIYKSDIDNLDSITHHRQKKSGTSSSYKEPWYADDFKFVFVTDIHTNWSAISRTVELVNSLSDNQPDVILNGGDTPRGLITEDITSYTNAISKSEVPVLTTIGNHDAWDVISHLASDKSVVWDKLIVPMLTWNIVQPSGASSSYLLYHYKDFNAKVRAISLDLMWWDNAQEQWLEDVLDDARTNNLAVIIYGHAGLLNTYPGDATCNPTTVEGLWAGEEVIAPVAASDYVYTHSESINAVDEFIEAGGKFIGWMCGHCHDDKMRYLPQHHNQLFFSSQCQGMRATSVYKDDNPNSYNHIIATYISVDLDNMFIKFYRIGASIDTAGRRRKFLMWDINNGQVISQW